LHGTSAGAAAPRRRWRLSLILYAEHEFNASTFTARTITSTLSDFYAAVTGAIGALRGPLHGGANEAAMELIQRYPDAGGGGGGDHGPRLAKKEKIMGFGHRVYKVSDPRSDVIEGVGRSGWRRAARRGQRQYAVAKRIEEVMRREKKPLPEPRFLQRGGLPSSSAMPDAAVHAASSCMSRVTGWSRPHPGAARRQPDHPAPSSEYIGPRDARGAGRRR
jgi:2-methylcitrate synthase